MTQSVADIQQIQRVPQGINPDLHSWQSWQRRAILFILGLLLAITGVIATSLIIQSNASISLGGLISEKLLGRSGIADSSLILASGTNTQLSILGFAPVVSTQPVVSTSAPGGIPTASLRGRVTSMNGMPTATGYFQWGYAPGALINTTTTFAVASTGYYSLDISGFNDSMIVYYRFVTDADGTAYGSVSQFVAASGTGAWLLRTLLRILLALAIIVAAALIGFRGGWIPMLIATLLGLIGFAVVNSIIETLF